MINPLITVADIREVRDISSQIKDSKINYIILDAEIADLRPLLGDAFLYDIKKNISNYDDLLRGSEYICGENTHYQFGVKRLLVELAYVRYTFDSSDVSTPFGLTNKNFNNGEHTSRDRAKELSNMRKEIANNYWGGIKHYLENSLDIYPLYKCGNSNEIKTFSLKNITR